MAGAILQNASLPFCPGSPRFLPLNRNEDHAKQILQRLWGTQGVAPDMQEMKGESARMAQGKAHHSAGTLQGTQLPAARLRFRCPAALWDQCCVVLPDRDLQGCRCDPWRGG